MSTAYRKGWCPGALRPMESGDGLIVRLRLLGGALDPKLARELAQCAVDFGNGLLDLSSRGNLQLRGITPASLPELQARLDWLGLLDENPEAEAVRNILASPLAGFDPSAVMDIRPQIQTLDERLRRDATLHRLPGKFLFMIDDGGRLPLVPEMADIAFVAAKDTDDWLFAVYLAGKLAGCCAIDEIGETAARLSHAFLRLRTSDTSRMADLIRRIGADAVAAAANLDSMGEAPHRSLCMRSHVLGFHVLGFHVLGFHVLGFHTLGHHAALGLGMPLGRLDAAALHRLASEAQAANGSLRLTPWRAILIVAERIELDLADRMRDDGFILDDDAPIRAVAACPGKPACFHGETDSQADGMRLAPLAGTLAASGIALHVSACAKGCAHSSAAPVTLVGRDGTYDLILDGRANDEPLLRGLRVGDVTILLQALAEIAPADRAAFAERLFCGAQQ